MNWEKISWIVGIVATVLALFTAVPLLAERIRATEVHVQNLEKRQDKLEESLLKQSDNLSKVTVNLAKLTGIMTVILENK